MNNAYGPDAISLGSILNRLCVQGYSDLVELRNKNEENGIGKELRSRRAKTYLIIQRHRFLQAYAILQWSAKSLGRLREAQDNRDKKIGLRKSIDYINSIINYVSSFLFVHDPQSSWKIGTSSVPLFDVSSALDLVGNGSFSLLPRCLDDKAFRASAVRTLERDDLIRASRELSERFSVNETQKRLEYFDDSEILQNVIQKQDHLISLRLLRSRNPYMSVLRKISYIVVGSGCMQILIPDQFKVKLYLGGDIDKPVWQVLAVELLVRAENDTRPFPELSRHRKLTGDNQSDLENENGKVDDEDTFNNNLVNSLGFLYPRPNLLQMNYLLMHMQTCMTKASENIENGNESSLQAGLSCLFEFNIHLALSILYTQALRLRNSRWPGYLDIEYVNPTEANKSQYLKISFWPLSLSSLPKSNAFASSIKIDIRESPITKNQYLHCTISPEVEEETNLSVLLNSHIDNIMLNNAKIESIDLKHQSKHLGDIPDKYERFNPNVSHNGLLLSKLNVEKLISLVVSIQTEHYLKKIRESLLAHVKNSNIPYLDGNSVSVITKKMKTSTLIEEDNINRSEFEIYLKFDLPIEKRLILSLDNRTAKIVSFLIDIENNHDRRASQKSINNYQPNAKETLKSQQRHSIYESILQKFIKTCSKSITESLASSSKSIFELWANLSKASIVAYFEDAVTEINRSSGSQYECSDIDPEIGASNSLKHLVSIMLGSGENVDYYVNIKCKSVLNENWDGRLATAVSVSLLSYSILSDGKSSAVAREAINSYPISISDEGKLHPIKYTTELITKLSIHAAKIHLPYLRMLQVRKLLLNIGFLESSLEGKLLTASIDSQVFKDGLAFNVLHLPITAILAFISYFISGQFYQRVKNNIAMKINAKIEPCKSGYVLKVMQISDSGEYIASIAEEFEVSSLVNRSMKRNMYSDVSLFADIIDRARVCTLYSLFQSVLENEKRKEKPHLIDSTESIKSSDLGILFTIQGKSMKIQWNSENESYELISAWDPQFPLKKNLETFMNELFAPGHPIEELIDALESILSTLSAWIQIHNPLISNPNVLSFIPISHREFKILLRDGNESITVLIDSINEVHICEERIHNTTNQDTLSSMETEITKNDHKKFIKMNIAEAAIFLQNAR